jgi:hypothetical protein
MLMQVHSAFAVRYDGRPSCGANSASSDGSGRGLSSSPRPDHFLAPSDLLQLALARERLRMTASDGMRSLI